MSDAVIESIQEYVRAIRDSERIKCRLEVLRLLSEPRVSDLRQVMMRWVDGKKMEDEND